MAKIEDKIHGLVKRSEDLESRIEFINVYLPLIIKKRKQKTEAKLEKIQLQHQDQLMPYAKKAQVKSEYLEEEKTFQIKAVNEKYDMLERRLKQTKKRHVQNKGSDLTKEDLDEMYQLRFEELENQKTEALDQVESEFNVKPTKEDQESYEKMAQALENEYNKIENELISKDQDFIKNATKKAELKIKKLQHQLSSAHRSIALLSKQVTKYELNDDVILRIDNLSMHFGGVKAVDDLSFEVKKGEIFGLIGPNGAGKTTVFNCITQFYKPRSGHIYYSNRKDEIVLLNKYRVHNVIREGIVRTFQNVELIWELTILENLLVGGHTLYKSSFFGHLFNSRRLKQEEMVLRKKAEDVLQKLDLFNYRNAYPIGLPYGILKRIELARTLMINPRLIILDEPAAGLNEAETKALAKSIRQIRDEYQATIFLVEHDMGLVMDICDTVCAINFGKKLAIGTPSQIQSNKLVREAYLGGE